MNKVFIVKEVHDYQTEYVIGVCPNRELAEKLRRKNIELWDSDDTSITSETWFEKILPEIYKSKYFPARHEVEIAVDLFPEYSESDIRIAADEYMHRSYTSTIIEEINLYATDSDIILYGINS